MSTVVIIVNDTNDVTIVDGPRLTPTAPQSGQRSLGLLLAAKVEAALNGIGSAKVAVLTAQTTTGATQGTATVTIAAGQPSAGDTVTFAGRVFTFRTSVTDQASNPRDVLIGAANTNTAANLAAQMALDPIVRGLVKPTVASNVVTLTENFGALALSYGTLAKSGANISISGASLTGGVASTFQGAAFYGLDNP